MWLTFVTESGRIFDMDLSALQFGLTFPVPYIVPVLDVSGKAFDNLCNRDTISDSHKDDFMNCLGILTHLMYNNIGRTPDDFFEDINSVYATVMYNLKLPTIKYLSDPEIFWRVLKHGVSQK